MWGMLSGKNLVWNRSGVGHMKKLISPGKKKNILIIMCDIIFAKKLEYGVTCKSKQNAIM